MAIKMETLLTKKLQKWQMVLEDKRENTNGKIMVLICAQIVKQTNSRQYPNVGLDLLGFLLKPIQLGINQGIDFKKNHISFNQAYLSLHTNFHAPKTTPSGRIQKGHKSCFIYYLFGFRLCRGLANICPISNILK